MTNQAVAGSKNHYVVYRSPGTLFSEESQRRVESWDVVKATQMAREITERHGAKPYAFLFKTMLEALPVEADGEKLNVEPKEIDRSPLHHLGGEVVRYDDVADIKQNSILRDNMRCNGYPLVIQTRHSYLSTQPFGEKDLVVNQETGAVTKRGTDPEFAEYRARMLKEWERL
jgi:hypothetical protein